MLTFKPSTISMHIKFWICIIASMLSSATMIASSFHLNSHSGLVVSGTQTFLTEVSCSYDSTGIDVTYSLGSLLCSESNEIPNAYSIHIEGFGTNGILEYPDIPFRVDQFSLPSDISDVRIHLSDIESITIPMRLLAQSPDYPASYNGTESSDKIASISTSYFNDSIVKIHFFTTQQSENIVGIEINPLQYDVDKEELTLNYKFKYRIEFIPNDVPCSYTSRPSEYQIPHTQSFLILTTPEFKESLAEFIEWKKQSGFNVDIQYSSNWNHNYVNEVVHTAYENLKNLKYLLIVGDNTFVPGVPRSFNGWGGIWANTPSLYVTDFPYSCIDNDSIPDIYVGRIPAQNTTQATNALSKILQYEKNPSTDETMYGNAIHTGIFTLKNADADATRTFEPFVYTCEKVREYVTTKGLDCFQNYSAISKANPLYWDSRYGNGMEIPKELQRPNFDWMGKTDYINERINTGVLYVLNCGHGDKNYWVSSAHAPYNYGTPSVQKLNNRNYPIFFNMNCWTGFYGDVRGPIGTFTQESLTQSLLGFSPSAGAAGVIAASEMSAMGKVDAMTIGFFNALWPDPGFNFLVDSYQYNYSTPKVTPTAPTFGRIFEIGRNFLTSHFGKYNSGAMHTERVMHLFGDPSMVIHTKTPTEFSSVTFNLAIHNDDNGSNTQTEFSKPTSSGTTYDLSFSCENAPNILTTVSFADGTTLSYESNSINLTKIDIPTVLTVTAPNKIPHIRKITPAHLTVKPPLKIYNIICDGTTLELDVLTTDGTTNISDYCSNIEIKLISIEGNPGKTITLNVDETHIHFSTEKLSAGYYIICLIGDNIILDSTKIFIP